MARGFDIPREQLEAGWEAEEDRLQKQCRHPITRTVTTEVRGVWKCLDCDTRLSDSASEGAKP